MTTDIEQELDKFGLVIQKGEDIFTLATEKFSKEYQVYPDDITIALLLFRKVIEKLDAIFILIENASEKAAESIARDLFENILYLMFVLDTKHFKIRALSYYYSFLKNRLHYVHLLSSKNKKGQKIRGMLGISDNDPLNEMLEEKNRSLRSSIKRECFANINKEWEYQERKKLFPKWHSLFKGPKTIKELSIQYGFETEYELLYRSYSSEVHSTNALSQIEELGNNLAGIKNLRVYEDPKTIIMISRSFGIHGLNTFINFFEIESRDDFKDWYTKNFMN